MKNIQQKPPLSAAPQKHASHLCAKRRRACKAALPLAVVAATALILCLPALRDQLGRIHELSDYLRGFGWAAPLVFVVSVACLVSVGVPRLLLCPIAGMAFGFWPGLAWVQIGTLLGYYVTFLFVHWAGRDFVVRTWPRLERYTRFTRKNGMISVLLIRQLPVTGFYVNLVLGLMPLRHADFLLGSLVGLLPAAVPATLLGAGTVHFSSGESRFYGVLIIGAAAALWVLLARFLRSLLKNKRMGEVAENGPCEPEPAYAPAE